MAVAVEFLFLLFSGKFHVGHKVGLLNQFIVAGLSCFVREEGVRRGEERRRREGKEKGVRGER